MKDQLGSDLPDVLPYRNGWVVFLEVPQEQTRDIKRWITTALTQGENIEMTDEEHDSPNGLRCFEYWFDNCTLAMQFYLTFKDQ